MKKLLNFQWFFPIILLFNGVKLQTSEDVIYGVCSCDVTDQYCDLNCCCDPDCSKADETSFNCPPLTLT